MSEHLKEAKKRLHPSNTDAGLPGREDKSKQLYNFLSECLRIITTTNNARATSIPDFQVNKTIFMCGVPGTGKTATLDLVIDKLTKDQKVKSKQLHPFKYAYINAQHLASADKIYPEIANKFIKERVPKEKCIPRLNDLFYLKPGEQLKKTDNFYIVAVDELDLLCNARRNTLLYSLFDWPTSSNSKMILVVIANAMDLSERLRGRLASRIGWEKVMFDSYTSEKLEKIVTARLGKDLLSKTFEANAIVLSTKKIGRSTGDARRILDTCCLAIDKAIEEGKPKVTCKMISEIGFQNVDNDRLDFLRTCPALTLMTLKCILKLVQEIGEENVVADEVYNRLLEDMNNLKFKEHFDGYMCEPRRFMVILNELAASSIIYLEDNKPWPQRRLYIKDTSPAFRDSIRNESVLAKFDDSEDDDEDDDDE